MPEEAQAEEHVAPRTWWRWGLRLLKRGFVAMFCLVMVYVAIVLIGLIPVNNGFRPAEDGIRVVVSSRP